MATYDETGSGGSVSSGTSISYKAYDHTPVMVPEPRIGGLAIVTLTYNKIATGGGVLGTLAQPGITEQASGGAVGGGDALEVFIQQEFGSGGALVSGGDLLFVDADGGAEVGGTADVSAIYNYEHQCSEVRVLLPSTVHSAVLPDQPGGLVVNTFKFRLTGSEVVPEVVTSNYSIATVYLDGQTVSWNIDIISLSSDVTGI